MIPARQSTAFETAIGPVLDADGVAVTGCVVGDFKIKKTSGNFAALNGSATLTHVSAGVYDLVLTTSDTDTVGVACIAIDDTVNACQSLYLQVMEEAIYDAMYAASANAWSGAAGSTTLTALASGSITAAVIADAAIDAATFAAGAITATVIATGAIDADALAADAGTELGTAVWASATRTLTTLSGLTVDTVTTLTNLPAITANWLTAAGTHSDFGTEVGTAVWASGTRTLTSLSGLTVDTVTTLTNLPAITANWLTAAGTAADFTTEIQSGLATAANLATVAGYIDTEIATIITNLATAQTSIDDLPTNAELATSQAAADDATLAAIAALNNLSAAQVLTTALTEAYATDGSTFTLSQGLYMIWSLLAERSISSTTLTAKKLDGSTSAMTFTLDSSSAPTSQTRAT